MTTRTMVCSYYPKGGKYGKCPDPLPSDPSAAFFEDRGPDSRHAVETCGVCGFAQVAHTVEQMERIAGPGRTRRPTIVESGRCSGFVPAGPADHDRYFCGCWGWD